MRKKIDYLLYNIFDSLERFCRHTKWKFTKKYLQGWQKN